MMRTPGCLKQRPVKLAKHPEGAPAIEANIQHRPAKLAERPNGRRAQWRAAKHPEGAPAIEAKETLAVGHRR
jgi:hypothetical protein